MAGTCRRDFAGGFTRRQVSKGAAFHGLRKGARVTVVAVTEPFAVLSAEARKIGVSQADHEREVKAAAAGHLAQAARKAAALGVACETIEVENERPYRGIIETATERQRDLIAMASHARRGITALVLNSETVNVMTHSAIPLLVYR